VVTFLEDCDLTHAILDISRSYPELYTNLKNGLNEDEINT
jgi:hypothetical protein